MVESWDDKSLTLPAGESDLGVHSFGRRWRAGRGLLFCLAPEPDAPRFVGRRVLPESWRVRVGGWLRFVLVVGRLVVVHDRFSGDVWSWASGDIGAVVAQFPLGFLPRSLPGCSSRGRRSLACPQRLIEQPPRTFSRLALVWCTGFGRGWSSMRESSSSRSESGGASSVGGTIGGSASRAGCLLGFSGRIRRAWSRRGWSLTCPVMSPTRARAGVLVSASVEGVFSPAHRRGSRAGTARGGAGLA